MNNKYDNKYVIECRYEYIALHGEKKFSSWFVIDATYRDSIDVDNEIKNLLSNSKDIDKKTKLIHEYRKLDVSKYEQYINDINKSILEQKEKQDQYYKSNEYKELVKKKNESRKLRNQKKIEYEQQ